MNDLVKTREDERIDQLAKRIYQTEKGGTVEALLNANPGLAQIALSLPDNRVIKAPQRVLELNIKPPVAIWD